MAGIGEKHYAGIGSRRTPASILYLMEEISKSLREKGYTLRSGHADGADYAFERGAGEDAEIYLPWRGYNDHLPLLGVSWSTPLIAAYGVSGDLHPSWDSLTAGARSLHARNAHQILGPELDSLSHFVICWTADGATEDPWRRTGGTGQALRIATLNGVPIYNLFRPEHRDAVATLAEQA